MTRARTAAPRAFASAVALERWLHREHARATELDLILVKGDRPGVTYRDALDVALCFGWIDGVRRAVDAAHFRVRFTPRKPGSRWSAVNVRRVEALIASGRMRPAGRAAFDARDPARAAGYSYEDRPTTLPRAAAAALRAHRDAHGFWQTCPPWYRRTATHWIASARQPATRDRRLATLIDCCARHVAIPLLAGKLPPRR